MSDSPTYPSDEESNNAEKKRFRFKTNICNTWLRRGFCPRGLSCIFAHGTDELQDGECQGAKKPVVICKFWFSTGWCRNGDDCGFLHPGGVQDKVGDCNDNNNSQLEGGQNNKNNDKQQQMKAVSNGTAEAGSQQQQKNTRFGSSSGGRVRGSSRQNRGVSSQNDDCLNNMQKSASSAAANDQRNLSCSSAQNFGRGAGINTMGNGKSFVKSSNKPSAVDPTKNDASENNCFLHAARLKTSPPLMIGPPSLLENADMRTKNSAISGGGEGGFGGGSKRLGSISSSTLTGGDVKQGSDPVHDTQKRNHKKASNNTNKEELARLQHRMNKMGGSGVSSSVYGVNRVGSGDGGGGGEELLFW